MLNMKKGDNFLSNDDSLQDCLKVKMNREQFWNKVYDILVEECEAYDGGHERENFLYHQMKETTPDDPYSGPPTEWRFQGALGFGGKFWRNNGKLYVNCYSEDSCPEREEMIEKANKRLAVLLEKGREAR